MKKHEVVALIASFVCYTSMRKQQNWTEPIFKFKPCRVPDYY